MTTAPFEFSMTFAEAVAAGLQPETTETIESGTIVIGEDGRLARFVCVERTGPHTLAWVSYNGIREFAHLMSRAIKINNEVCRTA